MRLRNPTRGPAGGSLWFLPAIAVLVALVAGFVLSEIVIDDDSPLRGITFQGGAGEARELLTVIAGTMITVTGLVFVLTVIALQIASSQFSPRLLRTFLRDRGTQVVLSTFVATFAYSLAGLHTVGRVSDGEVFVPRLAVSGALALALISVGMLVYYIHHITDSIRIDTIMLGVEQRTVDTLNRLHPHPDTGRSQPAVEHPDNALVVGVRRSGYVQGYAIDELTEHGHRTGTTVAFVHPIGHHVVAGRPLARVWNPSGSRPNASWADRVHDATVLSDERSIEVDVAFGVRQLVDIAIKAVGPSINDPYTSVQAIQHLSVILTDLAGRELAPTAPPVVQPVSTFDSYLELVCSHIRQEASDRPRVMVALLRLLEDSRASTSNPDRRQALSRQAALVVEDARRNIEQQADLNELLTVAQAVQAV